MRTLRYFGCESNGGKAVSSSAATIGIIVAAIIGLVIGYSFLTISPGLVNTSTTSSVSTQTETVTNTQTATIIQNQTTTTTRTIIWTVTNTSSNPGRPALYPLNVTVTVYCPGSSSDCEYSGQIGEASGAPINVNQATNSSFSYPAFYESGCGPSGPCTVVFSWTFSLTNTGNRNYLHVVASVQGLTVSTASGPSVTGSFCEAFCY
ncbi:MAG TPA: hypothetical protein VJN71_05415 [Nitrososphaerales archaeon]|nr:hypothetical protein [Nitrososphaerales archaeon]